MEEWCVRLAWWSCTDKLQSYQMKQEFKVWPCGTISTLLEQVLPCRILTSADIGRLANVVCCDFIQCGWSCMIAHTTRQNNCVSLFDRHSSSLHSLGLAFWTATSEGRRWILKAVLFMLGFSWAFRLLEGLPRWCQKVYTRLNHSSTVFCQYTSRTSFSNFHKAAMKQLAEYADACVFIGRLGDRIGSSERDCEFQKPRTRDVRWGWRPPHPFQGGVTSGGCLAFECGEQALDSSRKLLSVHSDRDNAPDQLKIVEKLQERKEIKNSTSPHWRRPLLVIRDLLK